MKDFEGFGLSPVLQKSLQRMNYTTPTPIQAQAIPLALKGRDIMGSAQTGTGKTAAFAIPLVEKLLTNPEGSALVLTPTRELGKQIMDIMHQLLGGFKSPIKTAFIIGGEPMRRQFDQLRAGPRLIVGTPGRINDHLERGSLKLGDADFLVLDETDRMLDMGFSVQLERIFKYLPEERQTLMFSATLPPDIIKMSKRYLNDPERIAVGSTTAPAQNIKQDIVRVTEEGKYDELVRQLDERTGSVIIFVKTKFGTERLAKRINKEAILEDCQADAIHGDLKQNKRERVIRDFRACKFRILVATDVVARGLDIPHIEHVINYDLPQVPEDYIHRIGRTARAGAEGSSLCMLSPQDGRKWHAIQLLINPDAKPERAPRKGTAGKARGASPFSKPRSFGSRDRDEQQGGRGGFGSSFGGKGRSGDRFAKGAPRKAARPEFAANDREDFRDEFRNEFRAEKPRRDARPETGRPAFRKDDGRKDEGRRDSRKDGDRKDFRKDGARPEFRKDGARKEFRKDDDRAAFRKDGPRKDFRKDGDRPAFSKDGPRKEFRRDSDARDFNRDGDRPVFRKEAGGKGPQKGPRKSFGGPAGKGPQKSFAKGKSQRFSRDKRAA